MMDIGPVKARLERVAAALEAVTTLPRPYELYYAVKKPGDGTGWNFTVVGLGADDIRAAATALREFDELQRKLQELLR